MNPTFGEFLLTTMPIALTLAFWGLIFALLLLAIRGLWVYISIHRESTRPETVRLRKNLGETIRAHRTRCGMTQELVAQRLGVSRQAVSKWESGASEPSTTNLLALAGLFEVAPEELLKGTDKR